MQLTPDECEHNVSLPTSFVDGQEGCICCNPDIQEASNIRYCSDRVWRFAELSSGKLALYNGVGNTVYIGDSFSDMIELYKNRPPYVPPERVYVQKKVVNRTGIDLGKLRISI